MFATGVTMGLAEWIIDDTVLLKFIVEFCQVFFCSILPWRSVDTVSKIIFWPKVGMSLWLPEPSCFCRYIVPKKDGLKFTEASEYY